MVQPQRPSVLHASVEGGRCLNVQLLPKGSEQLAANTKYLKSLVQLGGLEPPTSCSTDRRSNQLSYNCILASRASGRPGRAGIEGGWTGRKLGATGVFGKAATPSKRPASEVISKAKPGL